MDNWKSPDGLRIWRSKDMDYYSDEAMEAADAYTDEELASIAADGFNAVWVRGQLQTLMNSSIFSELNDTNAQKRIESLKKVIERAKRHGIKLFLYFNEPLALKVEHPFWETHPELKGVEYEVGVYIERSYSLCTSTKEVQDFLRESIGYVFGELDGLGGVILITASEYLTHCWSHYARFSLHDNIHEPTDDPLGCPRCRDREPADVVAELLGIWAEEAEKVSAKPRVLAWNWSWCLWYPDPQAEIISKFPAGVELLADWERGGKRQIFDRDIAIDEYSLGYVGPSERFSLSAEVARKNNIPVNAKMQLGTTHELSVIPNLPLMSSLYKKLASLTKNEINGIMGTWNIGCTETLNRYAVGLFCREEVAAASEDAFMKKLSSYYFGNVDCDMTKAAWKLFSEAFSIYPFSIAMLYWGPMNYAPAYPLDPEYHDRPMGPSWQIKFEWGDRLEDCLGPYSLDECIELFERIREKWMDGLKIYESALTEGGKGSDVQLRHRIEELSVAKMVGCHIKSMKNIFAFHRWRKNAIQKANLAAPCSVKIDDTAIKLMRDELPNVQAALELVRADSRLGFHEEDHSWMINPKMLEQKITYISKHIYD